MIRGRLERYRELRLNFADRAPEDAWPDRYAVVCVGTVHWMPVYEVSTWPTAEGACAYANGRRHQAPVRVVDLDLGVDLPSRLTFSPLPVPQEEAA